VVTGNALLDGIIIAGAVAAAIGSIYNWFVRPVVGAASAIRDAVEAIPDHDAAIAANGQRLDRIDARLERGAEQFAEVGATLAAVEGHLGQPSNGETLCELVERHSQEDQANFRAIGDWTGNFKDFDPLALPYVGNEQEH
jgi:hypothetical protein